MAFATPKCASAALLTSLSNGLGPGLRTQLHMSTDPAQHSRSSLHQTIFSLVGHYFFIYSYLIIYLLFTSVSVDGDRNSSTITNTIGWTRTTPQRSCRRKDWDPWSPPIDSHRSRMSNMLTSEPDVVTRTSLGAWDWRPAWRGVLKMRQWFMRTKFNCVISICC